MNDQVQDACKAITDSGLAGEIGFRVGVGVATGVVRIGTVGARQRIQHTVIGDTVNVASRIEGLTRTHPDSILISESTYQLVRDDVETVVWEPMSIKGKSDNIIVFEVVRGK